ncbi:MAG: bifunctional anthranilate synthase component II/anthranilate phosphoribosyltransferase [Anaerolineales bacterium]
MIVVIDNYDSFTYNLVQYLGELGAESRVFRNDSVTVEDLAAIEPSHLVISPGPGRPESDAGISNQAITHFHGRVPILGVCLGHQCIAHTFGARVERASRLMHGKVSHIMHRGDELFDGVPTFFEATRYHSLIVKEPLSDALQVIAHTPEGEIMALRHRDAPTYGVQFHPESILTPHGRRLLKNFLEIAEKSGAASEVSAGTGTIELSTALERTLSYEHLSPTEAEAVMTRIMDGEATPAQIGAYLAALRAKGETVDEITGFARAMRQHATAVRPMRRPLIDTCGTGGDGAHTFNISTTAALVVAGAGVAVAKHGNRSVSSRSGSADVLEALGVNLELKPEDVARCIDEVGFGFLFAPSLHPAMRHAIGPRREMGVRTVFNILGPLTNPAGASIQIIGVYDRRLVEPLAHVLQGLGSEAAYVVNSADGLDELSTTAPNFVARLRNGQVRPMTIDPRDYGLERAALEEIRGDDAEENAQITRDVLTGTRGPQRDIVLLNAGMALVAAGVAEDPRDGLDMAAEAIDTGRAAQVLEELIAFTQGES